ncbi:MAG: hypothetical protein JWM14_2578 [Chitinophagaceae bacterium]|nr:hypothetical protein [Chitinophagaceae bacterium]
MNYFYQKTKAILTAALIAMTMTAHAAFVRNLPTEIKQPDGVTLHVFASGDEHYNWVHDQNNFTIVKNKATGYFVYATKVNGLLEPTDYVVGKINPAEVGLTPGLLDDDSVIKEKAEKSVASRKVSKQKRTANGAEPDVRSTGDYNNIVVYIQFSDQVSDQWTLTRTDGENRFNATGVVSVKDFYKEVSNNQLNVNATFYPQSTATYPVSYTDSHPRTYYQKDTPDGYGTDPNGTAPREHELLKNAINAISSQVPASLVIDGNADGLVDNVTFVIKGYTEGWAELLWPHRWSLFSQDVYIGTKKVYDYNIVFGTSLGVGVISHELFHSFGAPDLYQYSAWNSTGAAVGPWDLMASEDWNTPQHMTAYLKQEYGKWTTIPELTTTGTYSLQPVSASTLSAYKIKLPNSDDYVVLEYRKKEGKYETMVPASGLIVSLVHPGGNNAGGPTNELYVFHKDGTYSNAGDVYDATFGNGRNSFNDQTTPACFKSDGTPCGLGNLGINNITITGTNVTFNYTAPTTTTCSTPAWDAAIAYTTGQEASYAGNKYRAKWWTQNNRPDLSTGSGQPWELIGPCGSSNLAPAVTFTSPAQNSTFPAGTAVNLAASAVDADGTIDRVEFLDVNNLVVATDKSAPYEYATSGLTAGTYVYKANAYDNLGAISPQATVSFTINTASTVPTIVITSPTQNQEIWQYPSTAAPIDVLVTTNNTQTAIDSVQFIVVETVCNGPGCNNVSRYTKKVYPFTLSYQSVLNNNGFTQVTAIAWSHGVNSEQSQVTFYARPLPELTIVSPTDNSSIAPNTAVLIDVDVNSNKVFIDSVVYTVFDTQTTGMNGVTTTRKFKVTSAPYDLTLPAISGKTFSRVFALAYASQGKFSESKSVTINYNYVPTVVITAPAVASKFNVGGSVTVKANVTDSDGSVVKVEIYSPHIPNSTITLTAAPYEATFADLQSSGIRGLTTFVVKATDNKGGVNGATIDVIENKAPLVTVTAPLPKYSNNNIVYVVGSTITVSANATDADGTIAKVEISQGANAPVVKTAAPYTATFASLPAPAPDGSIYFTVKAYDNNGATTSALIIAYKNRLPNIAITAPASNSTVTPGSAVNITTLASDVDGAVAKVEFFNGATKLGEATAAPYSFSIASAVAGTYSLTAKATDDLGQSTTSPVVTVNVVANTCTVAAWSSTPAYTVGNRVSKGGTVYEAKWWTQNEDPVTHSGQYDSWKVIGPCNARLSATESLNTVTLSPVPFSDELFINIKEDQAHIELYDLFGTKVAQADGSGIVTLPTAAFAPGLYLCKVFVNGESKSFTVVKR